MKDSLSTDWIPTRQARCRSMFNVQSCLKGTSRLIELCLRAERCQQPDIVIVVVARKTYWPMTYIERLVSLSLKGHQLCYSFPKPVTTIKVG